MILALTGGLIYTNSTVNARVTYVDATLDAVRTKKSTLEAALYREQIKNVEVECDSKKLADALGREARLKIQMSCPMIIPDVDYTSEETIASDLKDFIKQIGGDVIETNNWDTVFADPNPTIHRLYSGEYMWAYAVYKLDAGRGSNAIFDLTTGRGLNAIFDLANGCWLDLGKE